MLLFRYKITEIYRQSHIKAKQMSRIFCRYSTLHTYICHIHDFFWIFIKELCLIKRTSILGKQHISEQTKPSCMLTCNNSMDNTMHSMTGQFWASWFALTIFEEKHMHKGTVGKKHKFLHFQMRFPPRKLTARDSEFFFFGVDEWIYIIIRQILSVAMLRKDGMTSAENKPKHRDLKIGYTCC